jgi:hypothetical protein
MTCVPCSGTISSREEVVKMDELVNRALTGFLTEQARTSSALERMATDIAELKASNEAQTELTRELLTAMKVFSETSVETQKRLNQLEADVADLKRKAS